MTRNTKDRFVFHSFDEEGYIIIDDPVYDKNYLNTLARNQLEAFGAIITVNPIHIEKYSWTDDNIVYRYLSDESLGGGSLANMTLNYVRVETPLYAIAAEMNESLVDAYVNQEGYKWAGGFFLLLNVKATGDDDSNEWYDIALYSSVEGMDEDIVGFLNSYNGTSNAAKCCFEDTEKQPGLKHALNGMVRIVNYERNAAHEVYNTRWVYDGMWAENAPKGFGRMTRGSWGNEDNCIGYFDGFNRAAGKYTYFKDFELTHWGLTWNDYREPPQESRHFTDWFDEQIQPVDPREEGKRADAAVAAFVAMATRPPTEFDKFNHLEDSAVAFYWATAQLGGGSLAGSRIKVGSRWVDTPVGAIVGEMADNLKEAYMHQSGASWAGGFFLLEDIRVSPDSNQYLDVALLSSIHEMNDEVVSRLKELNATGQELCCWAEGTDADIQLLVNGIARMVYYAKDAAGGVHHVMAHYEGEYYKRELEGFGRLMLDLHEGMQHHRENVIGYFAGDGLRMNGKTIYWSKGELVYSGEQYGEFRDVATVEEYDFDSFMDAGHLEEEEEFEQWQAEQRALAEE